MGLTVSRWTHWWNHWNYCLEMLVHSVIVMQKNGELIINSYNIYLNIKATPASISKEDKPPTFRYSCQLTYRVATGRLLKNLFQTAPKPLRVLIVKPTFSRTRLMRQPSKRHIPAVPGRPKPPNALE